MVAVATMIAMAMAMDGDDDNDDDVDNDDDDGGGRQVMGHRVWGRRQAAEGGRMGIKRKWEQCGYDDRRKNLLVKLVGGIIFICILQCSRLHEITSIFLALSWSFVIIPSGSGLWQARG